MNSRAGQARTATFKQVVGVVLKSPCGDVAQSWMEMAKPDQEVILSRSSPRSSRSPGVRGPSFSRRPMSTSRGPAAEAIRRHGVGHVVSVTALERSAAGEDKAGLVTASIRMDDLLMATGREARYLQAPFEAFGERLAGFGMGPSFVKGYIDMMSIKNEGMDNQAERGAPIRTATTYHQWAGPALRPALAGCPRTPAPFKPRPRMSP